MKRLYIIIVALVSMCYMHAQDRIYVHRSNGNVEAITLSQLDSLSLVTTSAHLQITADSDTVRVGETVKLSTNVIPSSVMDARWGTRDIDLLSVGGSFTSGWASGRMPGLAEAQVICDGFIATYPLTVIGRATSTGAPLTYWEVARDQVQAGEQIAFEAQYDSKKYPVDYTSVWYDVAVVEDKSATCALIKVFNYTYTPKPVTRTIHPLAEKQRYTHSPSSWSEKTASYTCKSHFSVTLNDTLASEEWTNPRDTNEFALKIKTYFGASFPQLFKDSVKALMDANNERNYNAYMQVFSSLSLLSTDDIEWMTDSVFDANANEWKKFFKQYDTIFSKTNFDTLGMVIDSHEVRISLGGRPPKFDTVMEYDTTYIIQPWIEGVEYVYDQILERIDRLWCDSVSYLDLLVGADGYAIQYKKTCQVNAEFRVYDKKGNYAKSNAHAVVINNPVERVKITASDLIIANETPVTLQAGKYYTTRQGIKQYKWLFPDGTKNVSTGSTITSYEGEIAPTVIFSSVGTQYVRLQVTINGVLLPTEVCQIQVASPQALPTLYYATAQGNIMAYKLPTDAQSQSLQIQPYDLGFYTQHAFNLHFKDSLLYVLDAGKQFTYTNNQYGAGDGKISVLSKDGSRVETMITNVGQDAFNDPYYGCIDGDYLYYANRNVGIVRLHITDRNEVYSEWGHPWYVQNNTLGYYNNGWAYGCLGANFCKINGVWHWAKYYNGNGIFRFKDSDILPAPISQDRELVPQDGIMLEGMWPKSFVYVPYYDMMIVHIMDAGYNGVYACRYDQLNAVGSSKNSLKPYAITYDGKMFESNTTGNLPAKEGTGSESIGICQMVYDEVNDCVYFAYRNNSAASATLPPTGIYRYSLSTGQVTCLIEGVEAYGLTVNNTPSKLF